MTVMPPATIASTTPIASLADRALRTGIIPAASSCCFTSSDMLFSFAVLDSTGNTRGAAQHHPLYLSARSRACISGRSHRERAMRYSTRYCPSRGLTHEHPENQPGSKRVSTAHSVHDVYFALRHVLDLILIDRHSTPGRSEEH